jgi:putative two-component system response regulator
MQQYGAVKRLIAAMSVLHEEHDHHGTNTAALARALAIAQGMPASQVELIEVGASLHDIGKLMIAKHLLNAPRKLEEYELTQLRTHTSIGWAIVDQAGFEPTICEIVRHHHERFDGNGYPDGLPHQAIPLTARLVAICDVYSALISPRSYRSAYSPEFARSYVQAGKGSAFDPRLVELFFAQVIVEPS